MYGELIQALGFGLQASGSVGFRLPISGFQLLVGFIDFVDSLALGLRGFGSEASVAGFQGVDHCLQTSLDLGVLLLERGEVLVGQQLEPIGDAQKISRFGRGAIRLVQEIDILARRPTC